MTLFAVACAGIFPLAHTGRPGLRTGFLSVSNTMRYWPNFRSPLVWTWLRFRLTARFRSCFGFDRPDFHRFCYSRQNRKACGQFIRIARHGMARFGRTGTAMRRLTCLLAVSRRVVLSVHTASASISPWHRSGWHTTIFPPYFVAASNYSGCRHGRLPGHSDPCHLWAEDFITERHLENRRRSCSRPADRRLWLFHGAFMGWYSGSQFDSFLLWKPSARAISVCVPRACCFAILASRRSSG